MPSSSALSTKCCKIIDEYETQLSKEFGNTCIKVAGSAPELNKCNNLRKGSRLETNLVNSVVASESPFRRDSSLIWLSYDPSIQKLNEINKIVNEDGIVVPDMCDKYVLVDTYTSILASNRQQACYISLLSPLPQDTVVGIKFGDHLCQGKINDTMIEYISPSLPVGRQYAKLYLNSVKMGVKFGNGSTMSEARSYLPFDVIVQEPKSRKLNYKKNKTPIPVGVMGPAPLPEVDIEDEVEELLIIHKPRGNASIISRKYALDKYFKGTHSKVVSAPRRETGDYNNLDPSIKAAVNRDFLRRLSNITLEPDCRRTINLLNEFISKLDPGATGNLIPFNIKLEYWNRVIADGCQEIIDNYHSYITQETSNEKSVYIFTRTSPDAFEPYNIFMFSCIMDEANNNYVPLLRRFTCNTENCGDVRLWLCVGDCYLIKNEVANNYRKIDLPCPIPPIMKSKKSLHIWNRARNQSNQTNSKYTSRKLGTGNSESTRRVYGGSLGAAGVGASGIGIGISANEDINTENNDSSEKDRCIQISNDVFLFFEMWPSKLLPNAGNTTESYSFTICIKNHQYHSVTGISKPVLSFILQKWLTKVPISD
ncbi:uncharacterized protein cubi_00047 [Cryptosporidium ubiquitum]|uniref:Uncharacterized protein n=1 Tax=Cryptosporidium ubiquitum TaxID=857276 RepID=A0A1J4MJW4_9CRYT|nr:uncharacterized protein cubi_00047 [Cryptosporidium ubiquitum]OII74494.1 hypothetical protein cubi_00047 [Cryptosporidium ubiquitum]